MARTLHPIDATAGGAVAVCILLGELCTPAMGLPVGGGEEDARLAGMQKGASCTWCEVLSLAMTILAVPMAISVLS